MFNIWKAVFLYIIYGIFPMMAEVLSEKAFFPLVYCLFQLFRVLGGFFFFLKTYCVILPSRSVWFLFPGPISQEALHELLALLRIALVVFASKVKLSVLSVRQVLAVASLSFAM